MKKIIKSLILSSMLLIGCGGNVSTGNTNSNNSSSAISSDSSSTDNIKNSTVDSNSTSSASQNKKEVLRYSSYSITTLDRKMIEEYNKIQNNVEVIIVENIQPEFQTITWEDFLYAQEAKNEFPDVLKIDSIPYYIEKNWIMDISEFVKNDEEFKSLNEDIKNSLGYEGMTFVLPSNIIYQGYYVNNSLYNETLKHNISFSDFISKTNSIISSEIKGINGIDFIIDVYPSILNDTYEWFTFDKQKFNLDSLEFNKTIQLYKDVRNSSAWYDPSTNYEGIDYLFENRLAANYDSTLSLEKYMNKEGASYDFIGVPSYDNNTKTPIIIDHIAVSKKTKNALEAYKFSKWMGINKNGYLKKIDLGKEDSSLGVVNYPPMVNDEEVLNAYFDLCPSFNELRNVIENQSFVVDLTRTLPGYSEIRYQGIVDNSKPIILVLFELMNGIVEFNDISNSLNLSINNIYNEKMNSFKDVINKNYITSK